MTSKEALILLLRSHFGDGRAKRKVDKYCDEIENQLLTDLDRLEELEKVIGTLQKALLLNVKEVRGIYYVLGYDTNYCMTKEEYELLKGVLENDSNKRIH